MQAPGGPDEDSSGGFKYGGWSVPFFDAFLGNIMEKQIKEPFDLLLGRNIFEIFAVYWPDFNDGVLIAKYKREGRIKTCSF